MSTALTILDRPGFGSNTDVIVVVLPRLRALLWVPRDLWAVRYGCRINRVFARHGHDGLLAALRDLGVAAGHSVCVERELVETLLEPVSVEVPVPRPLEYWYPLAPQRPIEEGRRLVRFAPPSERLEGVRIHEWLGARTGVGRWAGDPERIRRQQAFVRALLASRFDPELVVACAPRLWSASGPRAGAELRSVNADWRMLSLTRYRDVDLAGERVSLRFRLPGLAGRLEARVRARRLGATVV